MKSFSISLLAFACMVCTSAFSQQIVIDDKLSAEQLIENHLIQGCVETSNIESPINGAISGFSSFGYFERGSSNFPFKNGIVLSTGKASSGGNGIKEKTLNEGDKSWGNDTDLEAALGLSNTLNATAIEFDFSSISNQIQFNYILASEEYYGNFPCEISDGFAFLIKEAGTNDPYVNIALIPGTSTPVNTNTIHNGINNQCGPANAEYFEGYNLGDTNYNGRTKVLTATASILPNVTYHIKLVIADYLDENYDSAVFIEGNSFNSYVDLGDDIITCADQVTINGDINNPSAIYSWFLNDTLIQGENQTTLTANQSGTYTVKVEIPIATNSCTIEDSIDIVLSSTQTAAPISDFELCDDISSDGVEFFDFNLKTPDVLKSVPNSDYRISYHFSYDDALNFINEIVSPIQNSINYQVIHVRIEDTINGCMAYSTLNLVVNPLPVIVKPSDLIGCADDIDNGLTMIDLTQKDDEITNGDSNLKVSYYHTLGDADSGENAISSPYNNRSRNEHLFVRVENSLTGCSTTTTLLITVLDKPVINTTPHFIDACDPEHDGFAEFDLTSITPNVLGGITGVSTSFHETYDDALSGSNAIANPNSYTNTKQNVQIVFIRVTNDISGCASVTPVEIHTNLLLTGTLIQDFSVCDIEDVNLPQFDLNDMEETIVNNLPDVTIDFYESPEDQSAQSNALNKALPYIPSQLPKKLYITLRSSTCSEISEIELILNPIVNFPSIGSVTYCDTDQDLLTSIDLGSFSSAIANGEAGYTVRYYKTEIDARNDSNRLPSFYKNLTPTITIYTRTISNATSCADVKSFEITVLPAPETNLAEDIIVCDADQDGFSIVDLSEKISEIVSDTSNRLITFHTSLSQAENGTNAIVNARSYKAKTETIYARVQSTKMGECHSIEPIKIIVNTLPIIPVISNYIYCEDGSAGFGDFIFKTKDAEILKGQSGKQVSYYLNSYDAEARENSIEKSKAFSNTSTRQNIYVRVENIADITCYSTGSFYIEVGTNPTFNAPRDWFECDDISNDGRGIFDLSYIVSEIKKDIKENLNITFYASQANAEKAFNPLPLEYTNIKNPQLIFARIDNGSICAPITTFNIGLTRAPEANPSKPLVMCSPDNTEKLTFDLTLAEFDILDVRQYNLDIQYYANAADADLQTNVIKTPKAYTNVSNPQIVYVRITDIKTHCYLSIPIDLIVNLPPVFNPIDKVTICANTSKYFNLTEINDLLINDSSNIDISYFKSQADALSGDNAISKDYTYKTSADRFYIRMENINTHCFSVHNLMLKIDPLPIAYAIPDLDHCDDDFDGLYTFDLSQQTSKVLKSQDANKFSITYHKNIDDAKLGENALSTLYAASDMQTIYVRIKNKVTGCYNTTKFKTIVHPRPIVDIPNQVICVLDGSIVVSANTSDKNDTYLWSNNATTSEIEIATTELGTYWVRVTSIFGCETTSSFEVIESESATINFTETIDFSDPNNITVTISGIGNYMYVLNDNKPQKSNVFEHVPIGPNLIKVIDLNGCAEVTKEVIVLDTPKFMTPNDDGYFDTWHITGVHTLPGTVIFIYDRYGKQLAYLTSTSQGWDGTHNGQRMPSSDYWFVATVKKEDTTFQLKGHFALKR